MAHFFKYSHRPIHKGTKEYEEREERDRKQRESGMKNNQSDSVKEAKEAFLKRQEEAKIFRKINKARSIKKVLDKHN